MKLITKDTDYAIKAIAYIASKKNEAGTVSVPELSEELSIPKPFLRKILQTLNKNKILKSYKGLGGGFKLATRLEKIYLIDVVKIFQGPFSLNNCFLKKKICPDTKSCVLRKKIEGLEKNIITELNSINLSSLLKKGD